MPALPACTGVPARPGVTGTPPAPCKEALLPSEPVACSGNVAGLHLAMSMHTRSTSSEQGRMGRTAGWPGARGGRGKGSTHSSVPCAGRPIASNRAGLGPAALRGIFAAGHTLATARYRPTMSVAAPSAPWFAEVASRAAAIPADALHTAQRLRIWVPGALTSGTWVGWKAMGDAPPLIGVEGPGTHLFVTATWDHYGSWFSLVRVLFVGGSWT